MIRVMFAIGAIALLLAAWFGPLPELARQSFAAHMTLHITVVAVAAPLLAAALAGTMADPTIARPQLLAPIPASIAELVVVWAWHVPVLHHTARQDGWAFALEQATFVAAGLALWLAAVGGTPEQRYLRAGPGVVALLFTSMHMTLLGALFALGNRPLYEHGADAARALADQHLGGAVMLLVGGASYVAGGLWLMTRMLRAQVPARAGRREPAT